VPVISLSLGYPDGGCRHADDILLIITLESKHSTARFPEPACAWSFYTLLALHVRLCRPALRKGFAFPGEKGCQEGKGVRNV